MWFSEKSEQEFKQRMAKAINDVVKPCTKQTAEEAAKAVLAVIRPFIEEAGQKPDIESFARPYEVYHEATGKMRLIDGAWRVSWEAGPYAWGIWCSYQVDNRLAEPHYSFDLVFYNGE